MIEEYKDYSHYYLPINIVQINNSKSLFVDQRQKRINCFFPNTQGIINNLFFS